MYFVWLLVEAAISTFNVRFLLTAIFEEELMKTKAIIINTES
jgi:hypothetical protein